MSWEDAAEAVERGVADVVPTFLASHQIDEEGTYLYGNQGYSLHFISCARINLSLSIKDRILNSHRLITNFMNNQVRGLYTFTIGHSIPTLY